MTDDGSRALLERLVAERGEDYAGLSRLIGRNPAYIQQYIKRGTPRRLAEEDRRVLARYLGIDEVLLGGPPSVSTKNFVAVARLEARASAGAGALDPAEQALGDIGFDPHWLRRMGLGSDARSRLSIIRVEGDSMAPTLGDGDEILVDSADGADRLRDGVYVLRLEGALMVKRLSVGPGGRVTIRSDNRAYPSWPDCDRSTLDIVGRVAWLGRRLR
jgi:phage repressor protein C with HTH and peptisase S24 domain